MIKKGFGISIFLILILTNSLFSAQNQSIPQLLAEFNRISNPQSPTYNERRIKEILAIMERIAPTRAPQLEVSYLRPLSTRLEQALATARATEERLNQDIARLQTRQRQAEQQLRQSEESLQRQTTIMQQQQTELAQLQQNIFGVQTALEDTLNQLTQERQQHVEAQALLQHQIDQAAQENNQLQADFATMQNALQEAQTNYAQELELLRITQQQALHDQMAQNTAKERALQEEVATLKKQLAEEQSSTAEREKEIAAHEAERATAQEALRQAQESHAQELAQQRAQFEESQRKNQENDTQINQLTQQIKALEEKINTLKLQPKLTPEALAQNILTAKSIRQAQDRFLQNHPLFNSLDLDAGTATQVTFGTKRYNILNPNLPALNKKLELEDLPQNVPEEQNLTEQAQEAALTLAKDQEAKAVDIQDESLKASKSLSKDDLADFVLMTREGIHEEGSCGDEFEKDGTIILYSIHGTWSNKAAFAGDIKTLTSYNIFKFACQLASAEQKRVQIISVSWSGALDQNDRANTAKIMANDAQERMRDSNPDAIWVIAHSHGCNIAAMAANQIYDATGKFLDVGILLACPTLDQPRPLGFKTVYAFYSQGDFTQMAGSIESKRNFDRKVPFATSAARAKGQKVYNIRTQMDGYDMDHVSIKWGVMPHLAKLLTYIDTYYSCYYDLEANTENDPNSLPLVAIRHNKPNCGIIDGQALAESERAKEAFLKKYKRDISSLGIKYISGLTWLLNVGREGASAWKGEPAIDTGYLEDISSGAASSAAASSS